MARLYCPDCCCTYNNIPPKEMRALVARHSHATILPFRFWECWEHDDRLTNETMGKANTDLSLWRAVCADPKHIPVKLHPLLEITRNILR